MIARLASRAADFRDAWRRPHEERTLSQRMAISSLLSTLEFGVAGLARLISTVILTRLLTPEDFGVYAVVLFILYLLTMVTDLGMRAIVLTHDGEIDAPFLRTCWTVQILRGFVIAGAVVLVGLGLAALQAKGFADGDSSYAHPSLPWIICASSALLVLQNMASPNVFAHERDMRFARLAILNIGMTVAGVAVTILCVLAMGSVWALFAGQLIVTTARTAASFLLFAGPAMRPHLDPAARQAIWRRGSWIIGHSTFTAAAELADRVLLSVFLSAEFFGFYYIARNIFSMFKDFFYSIMTRFSLQMFSNFFNKGAPGGVAGSYYKYRLFLDAGIASTSGLLFAIAPVLIEVLYDDRYEAVGTMLRILAIGLPMISVGLMAEGFSAQRRFREMALLNAVRTASIWISVGAALVFFDSWQLALIAVTLHRIPEIALLLWKGSREGWTRLHLEARILPLFVIGAAAGWMLVEVRQAAPAFF